MSAERGKRIAVLVFPGTNSENETLRLLRDCGDDPGANATLGPKVSLEVE